MAVITHDEYSAMFSLKVENLDYYWECTMNALTWPEDGGKGNIPGMIVDYGS